MTKQSPDGQKPAHPDLFIPDIAVLSSARKQYLCALLFEALGRARLHQAPSMENASYVAKLGRETILFEQAYRDAGGRLSGQDLLDEARGRTSRQTPDTGHQLPNNKA